MKVTYKSKKLEKICTDKQRSIKMYGIEMSNKIFSRIEQIKNSDSIKTLLMFQFGRCHALSNNRKGQYAMDLVHPYRLIFEIKDNEIQIANILEIVDYHK